MKKEEQLIQIFSDVLEVDNLTLESRRDEIDEWDSVAEVQIIVEIEEKFAHKVKMEETEKLKTIGDFMSLLN